MTINNTTVEVQATQVTSTFPLQGMTRNMVKYHAGPEHKQHLMGTVYVPRDQVGAAPAPFVEVTVTIPQAVIAPQ